MPRCTPGTMADRACRPPRRSRPSTRTMTARSPPPSTNPDRGRCSRRWTATATATCRRRRCRRATPRWVPTARTDRPSLLPARGMPRAGIRVSGRLFRGDVIVDQALEHRQRHRAVLEHDVVEVADVELRAQLLLRLLAQLEDLQHADLVRERLPRVIDV